MLDSQPLADDHSLTFSGRRAKLFGRDGQSYGTFVSGLRPRYWMVYRDIGLGYLFLASSYGLIVAAPGWGAPRLAVGILGAIPIGYGIAYLQLFLHEGAHYNLAPTKTQNDWLCNMLVAWLVGTTAAAYRPTHFQHHRDLGTTTDTEFTYFFPLNGRFLIKAAFGIRALEIMLSHTTAPRPQLPAQMRASGRIALLAGAAIYAAVAAGSLLFGWWWAAMGLVFGVTMAFPFFGALRQLLEHRCDGAISTIDYRKQDHGACTRIFPDDLFSRTFGGAGFNRHLLHHWEPQVSYTNLPELEAFLNETEMKSIMDRRRATYLRVFRSLFLQP